MRVKVADVKFVENLYPRSGFDNETVNQYRLNLDSLPPITLTKDMILVDGYHRLLAHRIEGREEIEAEIIDIAEDQVLWEATRRNSMYGRQLTRTEKRTLSRKFYKQNLLEKDITFVLAVSESTLSNWLKDLRQEAKEEQKQQIINLYLQCLTHKEIADKIGLSRSRITEIVDKFKSELSDIVPESLQLFNVWYFSKRDTKYGLEGAKGLIPGQIIENLLYNHTKPLDSIIIDPMAGGGTIIDVCKAMYRRYRAYDISPLREDITKHDITQGFPKECKNSDLIFLDPPYKDMVFKEFKEIDDFNVFMRIIAKASKATVKKGGVVAILMADLTRDETLVYLRGSVYMIFKKYFGEPIAVVSVPLSTQSANAQEVESAKEKKKLLGRDRTLFVFRK